MPRVSGARGQNKRAVIRVPFRAVWGLASFVAVICVLGATEVGQNLGEEGLAGAGACAGSRPEGTR